MLRNLKMRLLKSPSMWFKPLVSASAHGATTARALVHWTLVTFDLYTPEHACRELAQTLRAKMTSVAGMSVTQDARIDCVGRNESTEDCIKRVMVNAPATTLIFCLLPANDNKHIYNSIKDVAELELGVLTQCMQNKVELQKPNTLHLNL